MLRLLWGLTRTRRLLGLWLLWLVPRGLGGREESCRFEKLPVFSFSEITHEIPGYVIYGCKKGFTRFPSKPNVIYCIDGNWTSLEDPCGKVCPFPPKQTRAELRDTFAGSVLFPVGMVVHYVCKKEFQQIPGISNTISCGENQKWSALAKFCKGKTCENPATIKDGSVFSFNAEHTVGVRVIYMCFQGFTLIGRRWSTCQESGNDVHWSNPPPRCARAICVDPPNILGGFHNGTTPPFPYGTVIKYICNDPFSLIGEPIISCDVDNNNNPIWSSKAPKCQVIVCTAPVVRNGIKTLREIKKYYTFGSNITFECKIGYFMIGSYFIRCEANNTWIPNVPSCKKISRDTCGAPAITKASVYPLQPQYKRGSIISVKCEKKYSFPDETMEMSAQCKGYNLWDPPVSLCFFRTFPDNTKLYIPNGKIIYGEKEYYEPGDEVVIRCKAGYILKGSNKFKYVGGKKWLPNVPYCFLSLFLKLLIAGCLLPVVIVGTKMVYQNFCLQWIGTEKRESEQSTTVTKEIHFLPKNKVAVASPRQLSSRRSTETPRRIAVRGKLDRPPLLRSRSLY